MIRRLVGRLLQRLSPRCRYARGCTQTLYEGLRGRCLASDCPYRPKRGGRLHVDWEYLDRRGK